MLSAQEALNKQKDNKLKHEQYLKSLKDENGIPWCQLSLQDIEDKIKETLKSVWNYQYIEIRGRLKPDIINELKHGGYKIYFYNYKTSDIRPMCKTEKGWFGKEYLSHYYEQVSYDNWITTVCWGTPPNFDYVEDLKEL